MLYLKFVVEEASSKEQSGRIDVWGLHKYHPVDYIYFHTTKIREFSELRQVWDYSYVTEKKLRKLKKIIEKKYRKEGECYNGKS